MRGAFQRKSDSMFIPHRITIVAYNLVCFVFCFEEMPIWHDVSNHLSTSIIWGLSHILTLLLGGVLFNLNSSR